MRKRLLSALAALLLLPSAALAETLDGAWALRIDGATIFRFDLRQSGEGAWRGTWTRPQSFRSNGATFSALVGRHAVTSRPGQQRGEEVELTFDDPRPGAIPDTFRFRTTGEGMAEMTYVDTGFAPFPLVRVAQDAVLGPFEEGRIYDRDNAQTAPSVLPAPAVAEGSPPGAIWQPDAAAVAAVAARAAGSDPGDSAAPEGRPEPEPASRLGSDFLEGL